MTTAIFIKSFQRDFCWLKYCLRSIHKFCRGFSEIVIVLPENDREAAGTMGFSVERVTFVPEGPDGYTEQQIYKLNADEYTEADQILFVDSDCIFYKDVTPDYFTHEGMPYMLYTPYSELGDTVPWKAGTEWVLGRDVAYEFMRRHPMMYPREVLHGFRGFINITHGQSVTRMMLENCAARSLSEFNLLGAYAFYHVPNAFHWFNTQRNEHPPDCLHQFWSYGGTEGEMNTAKLKELEALL